MSRRDRRRPELPKEPKERVRRKSRNPSVVSGKGREADEDDEVGAAADPAGARLSRAERRRRRLEGSEKSRPLEPRQRALLGLEAEQSAADAVPDTAPPPAAPRPSAFRRHDGGVLVLALAVFAGGVVFHRSLTAPQLTRLARAGLVLDRPTGWLPPVEVPPPPLRLAADAPLPADAPATEGRLHLMLSSPTDPRIAVELRVAPQRESGHARVALALARAARYGEAYWAQEGESRTIAGRDWWRTAFRHASKATASAPPVVRTGIEYATVDGDRLYVVTFHGGVGAAAALEELIAPSLSVGAGEAR